MKLIIAVIQPNRLEAVKGVFGDFVTGGGSLPGRPDDLIGPVTDCRFDGSRDDLYQ